MTQEYFVITFDGTSASGKGTIAKKVAAHYGYAYLDTGKLYRALAFNIKQYSNLENYKKSLITLTQKITPELLYNEALYNEEITYLASQIASESEVRSALLAFQRDFITEHKKLVLDGRDTGSVIYPEAQAKFYIDADVKIRAQRRYEQTKHLNNNITISAIESSLSERDHRDMNRKISPLIIPKNAYVIDNSYETIEQIVKKIIDIIDSLS